MNGTKRENLLVVVNEKAAGTIDGEGERELLDDVACGNRCLLLFTQRRRRNIAHRNDAGTLDEHKLNIHEKQHHIVEDAAQLGQRTVDGRNGNKGHEGVRFEEHHGNVRRGTEIYSPYKGKERHG